jgi:hypothetical protein
MPPIDGAELRQVLLQVVADRHKKGASFFQSKGILNEVASRLGIARDTAAQQGLLTFFDDLFRQGVIGWGYDVANPDPPFLHLTHRGRETLKQLSRDPANPTGYLGDLTKRATINDVAMRTLRRHSKRTMQSAGRRRP